MTTTLRPVLFGVLVLTLGAATAAQTPAPATPAKPPAAGTAAAGTTTPPQPALPSPPPNYAYSIDGRRDPFVSLINRGADSGAATGQAAGKRAEGVAGLQVAELVVRGIVQSRGTWAAMVTGPDKKFYTIRAGDRLADGVVRAVTAQAVVILQDVNDPLSLEKQREVRKFLRGGQEVK